MKIYINKYIKNINLIIFIILLNLSTKASFGIENKIVLKIDNEIITSLDIEETKYLLFLNPNANTLTNDRYQISKIL